MRHNNILICFALAAMLFAGCGGGDYTPKPQAYLRIDMPKHSYATCDTAPLPFVFDKGLASAIELKKQTADEVWLDVVYPQWQGVVFLTYKRLNGPDDLRGQTDTSSRLLEKHYKLSSGVEEQGYEDPDNRVFGTVYYLKGSRVASTCQFWLTDSTRHFLRGALYLDRTPNNDSLAPVLRYMQEDIEHLVETLRWRK